MRFRFMNMLFNGAPAGIMNFGQFGSAGRRLGWQQPMALFLMGSNDGWGHYEIPVRPETSSKRVGMRCRTTGSSTTG